MMLHVLDIMDKRVILNCNHNMSETPFKLWCLVQGDFVPFPVDASPTIRIDNLKKIIIEELKLVLSPTDVSLWKVCYLQ